MSLVSNLYVTGYRSFELGIFQEDDEKIKRIKQVLRNRLINYLEDGLNWVLVSGNLGVEQWAVEVASELKNDYPDLQIGLIYPYANFGSQWKEKNQEKKQLIESMVDYANQTSSKEYFAPNQLKAHTHFMLEHTQGSLLVYDDEFPGKTKYFYDDAKEYAHGRDYLIETVSFDDLQNYEE